MMYGKYRTSEAKLRINDDLCMQESGNEDFVKKRTNGIVM